MKTICAISGLELTTSYFEGHSKATNYYHPIFTIPQNKLIGHTATFFAGSMNSKDSYLLFLAILRSTGQFTFKTPASYLGELTDSIVAQNMEHLLRIVSSINQVTHPSFVLPSISITKETCSLANTPQWLSIFKEALLDFQDAYKSVSLGQSILKKEAQLETLIKNPSKTPANYAASLASWAALAGSFPSFAINSPLGKMTCSQYWQAIIRKCVNRESTFAIPAKDIEELTTHCYENIPAGSIYSHALFSLLKNGDTSDLLDFKLLDSSTTDLDLEIATFQVMAAAAPEQEPQKHQYASKLAYLQAKARWDIKVQLDAEQAAKATLPKGEQNA